jgi:hypothetical protein
MRWQDFEQAAPVLAQVVFSAFEQKGLVVLGTTRRDGFPRISPIEHMFLEGELVLGMMWRSRKAVDLLRDSRCVVHSVVANPDGRSDPEVKVYASAVDVRDPSLRAAYGDAWFAKSEWRPKEPYHLFALDILSAGYVRYEEGDRTRVETWPPGEIRTIQRNT